MLKILIFTLLFITASCNHYNNDKINSAWLKYHNEGKTSSDMQKTKPKQSQNINILDRKTNKKNQYKIDNGKITVKENVVTVQSLDEEKTQHNQLNIISQETYFSALGVECTRIKYEKNKTISSHIECHKGDRKKTYRDLTI